MCLETYVKISLVSGALLGTYITWFNLLTQSSENFPTIIRPVMIGGLFFFGKIFVILSEMFFKFLVDNK